MSNLLQGLMWMLSAIPAVTCQSQGAIYNVVDNPPHLHLRCPRPFWAVRAEGPYRQSTRLSASCHSPSGGPVFFLPCVTAG